MSWLKKNVINRLFGAKNIIIIFTFVFVIYILSSYDVCYFPGETTDKGFVFSPNWTEHLHSSEEYTVYYQTAAFSEGRIWLTMDTLPANSDSIMIGNYSYALAEPVAAAMLSPFYTVGKLFLGTNFLIRSLIIGMIFYTCVNALLVRKISLQLQQSNTIANLTALLFAFTTMAFSYSRLLYPQPIVALLMLATIIFLLDYRVNPESRTLFCFAFFYALTVLSFNAFVVTAPVFLFYLYKIGTLRKTKELYLLGLGVLPSLLLFLAWNIAVTGNPILTPRQIVHPSLDFQILYPTVDGIWLNIEGLVGSLFSPVGIFFVSPVLFASFIAIFYFKSKAKNETILFSSIVIGFWLFISLLNLGGNTGRDFWVGGWANIARYMYIPSTIMIIFASIGLEKIRKTKNLIGAWLVSLAIILSFLANLSYGVRHDLMVGLLRDFRSTSLLIWPSTLGSTEMIFLAFTIIIGSLAYPAYLALNKRRNWHADYLQFNRTILSLSPSIDDEENENPRPVINLPVDILESALNSAKVNNAKYVQFRPSSKEGTIE